MEKRTKRLTRYFFMMIVVVSIFMINIGRPQALHNNYVNYYGIEMTDDEYLTLVNLGFTDDEIQFMTKETFEENKDLDATLVATGHKYFKITYPMYGASYVTEVTELEYIQQTSGGIVAPLGEIITTYIHEVSTISQNGAKYRYKDSVSWYSIPQEKYYDVTGIGFDTAVSINSSVYFNYVYAYSSGQYTTSTLYYDKKSTASGGSVVYKIPGNIVALSSNIYFDVIKNTTNTLTELEFCGDYAHALSSVTSSQAANHAIGPLGIGFDASVYNYYNQIPCADAVAYVNW
jgi:hypothetical protein